MDNISWVDCDFSLFYSKDFQEVEAVDWIDESSGQNQNQN